MSERCSAPCSRARSRCRWGSGRRSRACSRWPSPSSRSRSAPPRAAACGGSPPHSAEVHSFDLVEPPAGDCARSPTSPFTPAIEPRAAARAARRARRAGRATSTSCSSTATTRPTGVRRDLEDLLASPAVGRTADPDPRHRQRGGAQRDRRGRLRLRSRRSSTPISTPSPGDVPGPELDAHELWGGLGLIVVDEPRRAEPGEGALDRRRYPTATLLREAKALRRDGAGRRRGRSAAASAAAAHRSGAKRLSRCSGRPRIALVAREVSPLFGGGIGTYVASTAQVLAPVAEVTVFTTDLHRPAYERLLAAGDRRLAGMRIRFVPEPRIWELEDYHGNGLHLWSARAFEALCAEYPDGGPELVEFPDFLGEGFVTAQAARSLDPRLRNTTVCVRLCTTTPDDRRAQRPPPRRARGTGHLRDRALRARALRSRALARRRRARDLPARLRRGRARRAAAHPPPAGDRGRAGGGGRRRRRPSCGCSTWAGSSAARGCSIWHARSPGCRPTTCA